ncbi:sensor histidine kinase [Hymenobacter negativus]|uniref:histidine kinase n=1 Tax=Hymenobacter negativus TaxID=2795026 RepID=A0ABS3QBK8_9BACT|nr:ATP-binding protein [Hymenobacter negativus]MBO2008348.1 ATP-binding protein [Hymenobacter negativus]
MDKSIEQEVGLLYGGVVVMLLLALALVAFFLIYQKKLVSQQLALQTIQGAYQKEVFAAAIQAEERERERIGSDLHDEIGSSLSAAKVLMAQLEDATSATDKEQEVVALIKGIIGNSLQDIRNISQNLHPAVLAQFGLGKALHNLGLVCADAFPNGVAVHVELAAPLSYAHELALYRIVQELLNNALKHARASRVTVELRQLPHSLVLTVADDGRGFDYARVQAGGQGGLGLKSLAARVSLLDASLHLESAALTGTSVRVEVPLLG